MFQTFMQEVRQALLAIGLKESADPRDNSLLVASRGNFDGSFLLRAETGGEPFPQSDLSPRHFKQEILLEVATELKTSLAAADILVEQRAAQIFKAIFYVNFSSGAFYGWSTPRKLRDLEGKRIVWSVLLKARWINDV